MVTINELKEILETVFPGQYNLSEITEESNLVKDVGLNSIGFLYLAMVLEEKYGIQFSNKDLEKLRTVADVLSLIEERKS